MFDIQTPTLASAPSYHELPSFTQRSVVPTGVMQINKTQAHCANQHTAECCLSCCLPAVLPQLSYLGTLLVHGVKNLGRHV